MATKASMLAWHSAGDQCELPGLGTSSFLCPVGTVKYQLNTQTRNQNTNRSELVLESLLLNSCFKMNIWGWRQGWIHNTIEGVAAKSLQA